MTDLKKYKKKLKLEAILKSAIYGISASFITIMILNIILYFCEKRNLLITILVGLIIGIVTATILYVKKFAVSIKDIARRIDEQGLEERVITMVEYENDSSQMITLQKEDTKRELEKITAKAIPLKIAKWSLIVMISCLILSVPTCFLKPASAASTKPPVVDPIGPDDPVEPDKPIEEEVEDIIKKLLDELHKIIDNAAVNKNVKDLLNQIVDKLEEDLKQENLTIDEKVEMIKETKEEILRIIKENTIFRMTIAGVLKLYPITKSLGDAIQQRKIENVDPALEAIRETVNNSVNKEAEITKLIGILNEALEKATDEDNMGLIDAIKTFVTDLGGELAEPTPSTPDEGGEDGPKKELRRFAQDEKPEPAKNFDEAIDNAKENIKNALMSDEQMEEIGKDIATEIQDALDSISKAQQDEENKDEQEQPSTGGNDGEESDEDTPPSKVDDQDPLQSEKVIDGKTPYLEVLEEYKQQIIDYLNNNDLDDETRKMIETYLEMIG